MRFPEEEFVKLRNILLVYDWTRQIVMTKLNVLQQDLLNFHNNSPIDHIKGRIKTPESIAQKLHKLGFELTADNAKAHLKDIIGIRIICPFSKDIHTIVDIMEKMPDWVVETRKDYITTPKPSGYRSFHLIISVPVYYSGKTEMTPVEVQIRTAAMDFWAMMEHKVRYKYKEFIPEHLRIELAVCADKIAELDERMLLIQEIVSLINQD